MFNSKEIHNWVLKVLSSEINISAWANASGLPTGGGLLREYLGRWDKNGKAQLKPDTISKLEAGLKKLNREDLILSPAKIENTHHQSNFATVAYTLKKLTDDELSMVNALLCAEQRSRALSAALPGSNKPHKGKA